MIIFLIVRFIWFLWLMLSRLMLEASKTFGWRTIFRTR